MCVVSMVGDTFNDRWRDKFPGWEPNSLPPPFAAPPQEPSKSSTWIIGPTVPQITREEFDELKREVELLKDLLIAAKKYDEANNEPDCEVEEKVALLRAVAAAVGIDLDEVFGK